MLNLLKRVYYIIKARRNKTFLPLWTNIVNPQNIYFGNNCTVDSDCYFKAGRDKKPFIVIGNNVIIKSRSRISASKGKIEIGDHCYFGQNAWVGGKGNITINKNSIIAMNVVIISSNHDYMNITTPYYDVEEICRDIVIGENVWIGANCVITPGAKIGNGSVIGAGSVVRGAIEENSLVNGNPAQVVHKISRP